MGGSIERFLREIEPDEPDTQAPVRKGPISRWADEDDVGQRLEAGNTHSAKQTPQTAARVLTLAKQTGLDAGVVERNQKLAEEEALKAATSLAAFRAESPNVARWLAQQPQHIALARNSLDHLSYVERQVRHIADQFERGKRTTELAKIGEKYLWDTLTPEDTQRLARLETQLGDSTFDPQFRRRIEMIPGAVANQLPILATTIKGKLGGAALGAAAGAGTALALGQAGPQVATPEEVVTVPVLTAKGALIGWRLAGVIPAARLEANLAALEFRKLRDDNGVALDRDTIVGASLIVGAVNGALEAVGLESMLKTVPGLRALGREGVKRALMAQTTRQAFLRYAKGVGQAMLVEGGTEAMQSIVTHAAGELAAMAQDGTLNTASTEAILDRLVMSHLPEAAGEAEAGALAGGGITTVTGGTALAGDLGLAKEARKTAEAFRGLGEAMSDAEIVKIAPEKAQEVIEHLTKGGPVQHVYTPIETFQEYWQSKELDPAQVAEELIGTRDAYEQAVKTGEKLAIPTSRYAVYIAPTPHHEFFVNELSAGPEKMSLREADEFAERMDEEAQQAEEAAADESALKVEQAMTEQLRSAGFTPEQAATQATLYREFFRTMGARAGVDPMELFERYKLSVSREGMAAGPPLDIRRMPLEEVVSRAIAMRESQTERAAIQEEGATVAEPDLYAIPVTERKHATTTPEGQFVYARDPKGNLRRDFSKVATEGLLDELARLLEQQSADAQQAVVWGIPDESGGTFTSIGKSWVGMKPAGIAAMGRIKQRKKAMARAEAELAARGVTDVNERIFAKVMGRPMAGTPEEATAFDFALEQAPLAVTGEEARALLEQLGGTGFATEMGAATVEVPQGQRFAEATSPDNTVSIMQRAMSMVGRERFRELAQQEINKRDASGDPVVEQAAVEETARKVAARILHQSALTERRLLSGVHNLTAGNLIAADALGGLPAPSLAVIPEAQPFSQYGEITLIARKPVVDPQLEPVFDADAYTGRAPKPEFKPRPWKEISALTAPLRPIFQSVGDRGTIEQIISELSDGQPFEAEAHLVRSVGGKVAFLKEQGIEIPRTQRDVPLQSGISRAPAIAAFFAENGVDINARPGSDYWTKLSAAIGQALEEQNVPPGSYRYQSLYDAEDGEATFAGGLKVIEDQQRIGNREPDVYAIEEAANAAIAPLQQQYEAWVADKLSPFKQNPRIKVGRKYESYTLDSATAAALRARAIAGAEKTMTFGPGKARAVSSTRFRSVEHMRNVSEGIRTPDEVRAAVTEIEKRLSTWRDRMLDESPREGFGGAWEALDDMHRALGRYIQRNPVPAARRKFMRDALAGFGFRNISSELIDESIEVARLIRDAPVDYFEAKPQRAVRFDEFAAAVIPEDAPASVREILDKRGIPYRTYTDDANRAEVLNTFRRELYESGADVLFQRRGEVPRGRIKIGPSSIDIELLKDADLSTFLHETAHFYLEVLTDLADAPNADGDIVTDLQTIRAWVGATEGQAFTREQHEQFARGFEAYLLEGKAPTQALRSAFAKFRAWLVFLYRSVRNLNVELTPEVRSVFDRLVATETEIAAAQAEQVMVPLFPDPTAVGMTDEQAERYSADINAARTEAEEELSARLIADYQKELSEQWKAERLTVRQEVASEVNQEPVSLAFSVMARGKLPDGSPLPEGLERVKLSKQALEAEYATRPEYANLLKRLPRPYVYAKEGGVHPDQAADLFGFRSGDELIQALLTAEEPRRRIERITDERMRERHLDELLTPDQVSTEAMKAVHNEKRAAILERELQILAAQNLGTVKGLVRQLARRFPPNEDVRAEAEATIARRRVRDIQPVTYQRAEQKAARNAIAAFTKGDIALAFEEKLRERLNHELYRAAINARAEIDGIAKHMQRFDKPSTRARLGKAGGDYLDQIDGIRERYDFARGLSRAALGRRKALLEFVTEQKSLGIEITVPESLIQEAERVHYTELTLEELRGLNETVRQIEHLARTKNRLLASQEARELDEARTEIVNSIGANFDLSQQPADHTQRFKRLKKGALTGLAEHTRMEFLFEALDGGKALGPVWRHFFKPFADAENVENEMARKDADALKAIFGAYTTRERRKWFTDRINIAEATSPKSSSTFTKAHLLSIALNWGNDYNRQALMEGYGWDEAQVQRILERLDQRDWETVQAIWDYIESYWPQASALEKEITGLAPPKVEAKEVTTRFGTYRGGYYPIAFDRDLSTRQAAFDEQAELSEMFGGLAARAMTRHGHLIARTDTGGKPLLLDLSVIPKHLAQVRHDLAFRRPVIDVQRLIRDREVSTAIERAVGTEMYRQLGPWVKAIAGDRPREYSSWLAGAAAKARAGATVVSLGINVVSSVMQTLGFSTTVNTLGPVYAMRGVRNAFQNGPRLWQLVATGGFIGQRSPMMHDRMNNYDREVRDFGRKLSNISGEQASWFVLIGYMDLAVAVPTWLGAYQKAMDGALENVAKGDEEAAVAYADMVVRTTQSAGAAKDLASIQRGHEIQKLFTMFYSSLSIVFNQFERSRRQFVQDRNVPRLVASLTLIWFVPALLEDIIRGRMPDEDDDESWLGWLVGNLASYPLAAVVGVRDVANAIAWKLKTGRTEFAASPAFDAVRALIGGGAAVVKAALPDEAVTKTDFRDVVMAIGYVLKLPARQVWRSGETIHDWWVGDYEPASVLEGLGAVVRGKPRE
jgi:hypothetical protein